jgi:acetyltransferase-like isoleucine patch superfamily enzyme
MATKIGSGVYIGPNSVIQMGVKVGDGAIIGAMSFVNKDIPAGSKYFGIPASSSD